MHRAAISGGVIVALAVPAARADVVPVSRTTSLGASWNRNDAGSDPTGGSTSDGTITFDPFSRTVSAGGGIASQTSSITPTTVNASVSATGWHNFSVMHAAGASGTSTFTFVFDLTAPTSLSFTGNLSVNSPFANVGSVRLYNDATNALVHQPQFGSFPFGTLLFPFSGVYDAEPGRYRFVVSAANYGRDDSQPYTGAAQVTMTFPIPTPAAACLLPLAALVATRRRRS